MNATDKSNGPVPQDVADPIQYLIDQGATIIALAVAWGFRTTDAVYKLKRFDYVPPATTAAKMAESFGWTAGDVVNYWLDATQRKAAASA